MIGKTLGNYEILEPLGAGGMGEVYRARDATLHREVAIKVLPQELSGDADRLARLEREARLLASLNHPNIATIFGLEEIDATRFLVLELIDGESLQQALERGPLSIEKALDICGQVAQALEVAHEANIVHRDLKPANVLITRDGRAKVLDFGIAKALRVGDGEEGTAHATELTVAGTLVGTPPYMSPEQVRGEPVDKRSDVWAFGCLLYETLAGAGPFTRDTIADTLAAVVGEEPDWELLPAEVSRAVLMLLHRCLQKNPKARQRDIGDAWVEINQTRSHPGGLSMSLPPTIGRDAPVLRRNVAARLVVGALAIGAFAGWWFGPEAPAARVPLHFDFELPRGATLPSSAGPTIAISPDGNTIALVAEDALGQRLFLHRLDELGGPQEVGGSEGATYPFFSPDGAWLAFDTPTGGIQAISLVGGNAETLCRRCRHGAWGDDNSIIVQAMADSAASPWARIPEPGAAMEWLPQPTFGGARLQPDRVDVLPGSRAVLFEDGAVYAFSLETQEVVEVDKLSSDPYYAAGYVLFPRDNTMYAVPFDADALRVTGDPIVAQREVHTEPAGALHAAVSRNNGTLAFAPVETTTSLGFRLRWVDRTGAWEDIAQDDRHIAVSPRVSPDGRWIALGLVPDPTPGIWLVDNRTNTLDPFHVVDHETITRLIHPVWSRDSSSVTYGEIRWVESDGERHREQAIARKLVGGSRAVETLFAVPFASSHSFTPATWTPDGNRLIYGVAQSPRVLVVAPSSGERDAVLFEDDADTGSYVLSNDGKWLGYVSRRFGTEVVYVRPFPDGDEIRVSPAGGSEPRWAPGDRELFYIAGGQLMAAQVRGEDGLFRVDSHEALFDITEYPGRQGVRARYDVHPDGNRFVMIRPDSVDDRHAVNIVLDWFEGIDRLASEQGEGG